MVAVFPGSFDPLTYGHLDVIRRSANILDKLLVAVLHNSAKKSIFSIEERVSHMKEATKEFSNVEVISFQGLLADFLQENQIRLIVRSVRSASDYEYEMRDANVHKHLFEQAETIILPTSSQYSYLSSTVVREVASYGGNVSRMVPAFIEKALQEIYDKGRT